VITFCAAALVYVSSAIPVQAETLAEKKARLTTEIAEAKAKVAEATGQLEATRQQAELAARRVEEARVELDRVDGIFQEAQRLSNEKTAELVEADRILAAARTREEAQEAKVEDQRLDIAAYARDIYQDNLPMVSMMALLGASSPSELASRIQWTETILTTSQIDLDELTITLQDLAQARAECEEAQSRAEEAKQLADQYTEETQEARQVAEVAHTALLAALDQQLAAERSSETALAAQRSLLAQRESQLRGVNSQIAAANNPRPPAQNTNSGSSSGGSTSTPSQPPAPSGPRAQKVVDFAMSKVGGPYVWGGEGPTGYDCSGLTKMAYAQVGISLPHNARTQYNYGQPVAKSNLQPGDLVFYYSGPTHVGIYVGNGKVVHARNAALGIQMTNVDASPYLGARRLL
jgi:cell wall-associated NlpC family hydrolase